MSSNHFGRDQQRDSWRGTSFNKKHSDACTYVWTGSGRTHAIDCIGSTVAVQVTVGSVAVGTTWASANASDWPEKGDIPGCASQYLTKTALKLTGWTGSNAAAVVGHQETIGACFATTVAEATTKASCRTTLIPVVIRAACISARGIAHFLTGIGVVWKPASSTAGRMTEGICQAQQRNEKNKRRE